LSAADHSAAGNYVQLTIKLFTRLGFSHCSIDKSDLFFRESTMDPVSAIGLTASVIGIAGLAETIVSKALKYLKAVKDCEEEVRSLVIELNILAGILELLSPDDENRDDDGKQPSASPRTISYAKLRYLQSQLPRYQRI
jgi:hypothetical protein